LFVRGAHGVPSWPVLLEVGIRLAASGHSFSHWAGARHAVNSGEGGARGRPTVATSPPLLRPPHRPPLTGRPGQREQARGALLGPLWGGVLALGTSRAPRRGNSHVALARPSCSAALPFFFQACSHRTYPMYLPACCPVRTVDEPEYPRWVPACSPSRPLAFLPACPHCTAAMRGHAMGRPRHGGRWQVAGGRREEARLRQEGATISSPPAREFTFVPAKVRYLPPSRSAPTKYLHRYLEREYLPYAFYFPSTKHTLFLQSRCKTLRIACKY